MLNKLLLTIFILIFNQNLFSQTYTFKKKFNSDDRIEFLGLTKEIFEINKNISYNVGNYDTAQFEQIKPVQYNDDYLKKIQTELAKDSLNAITLSNFANYYSNTGNGSLAKIYFTKSLKNWSLKAKTKKDSAFYYSFKGILEMNLEKENAIEDIEKALEINPKDSIALNFYPIFLIQKKEFSKAKKVCSTALEDPKNENPEIAYLFFSLGVIFENMEKVFDESKKIENRKKSYTELFDYKSIENASALHQKNQRILYLKKMMDILGLTVKMLTFETTPDNNVIRDYDKFEIKKINQLKLDFQELLIKKKINPYSANKSLAMLYFFANENEKAIEHAKKAITIFPDSKRTSYFNSDEVYELLQTLYLTKKDDINFEKTLKEKIEKTSKHQKSINDYTNMAYLYLYKNDFEEAENWCNKAREIDPDNFKALSLLAHLKMMKNGLESGIGQFYLGQSSKQIKDESDNFNLSIQAATYMILYGNNANAKSAYDNIEACKKLVPKKTGFCDELINSYIQINP